MLLYTHGVPLYHTTVGAPASERLHFARRRLQFERRQLLLCKPLEIPGNPKEVCKSALQLLFTSRPALHRDRPLRLQFLAHLLKGAVYGLELLCELWRRQVVVYGLHLLALARGDQAL